MLLLRMDSQGGCGACGILMCGKLKFGGRHSIYASGRRGQHEVWCLTAVYGSHVPSMRCNLWN